MPGKKTRQYTMRFMRREKHNDLLGTVMRADLHQGFTRFKQDVPMAAVERALRERDPAAVSEKLPWPDLGKALAGFDRQVRAAMVTGAKDEADQHGREVNLDRFKYDARNPRIADYAQARVGELITTSKEGMVESVRAATARAMTHALTPDQVAGEIRDSLCLNAPQARALANYRSGLRTAANPLPQDQQDALADAYNERLLDQRAMTIARTEVRLAANQGQQDIWDQALEEGLLPPSSRKVWVVDGDPCPQICLPMDGVAVPLDEPWTLPDGREVMVVTESHPNCALPGQRVLTRDRGWCPIERIHVGEAVLTHAGRYAPVQETFCYRYVGEAVALSLAHRAVHVTAQHPVLTRHGYKPATDFRQGDDAWQVEAPRLLEQIDHQPATPRQGQKLQRVLRRLALCGVPRAMHLDRHQAPRQREVDVVGVHRKLGLAWQLRLQRRLDFAFQWARAALAPMVHRPGDLALAAVGVAAPGGPGLGGHVSLGLLGHALVGQPMGLAHAAQRDALLPQHALDHDARGAMVEPDLGRGIPRQVLTHDRVGVDIFASGHGASDRRTGFASVSCTGIRRYAYSGPVHNLRVDGDQSYVLEGSISHNCYCIASIDMGGG